MNPPLHPHAHGPDGDRTPGPEPDVTELYAHHRGYLWARELVRGGDVLDLGSGAGFGALLLSAEAASVLGIDADASRVEHARLEHRAEGLSFRAGDASHLSFLEDASFDAIVAFGLIEHVDDQRAMLAGVARILRPGGLLVISAPDQGSTGGAAGPGFGNLLSERFRHVALVDRDAVIGPDGLTAPYPIGIASDAELPPLPLGPAVAKREERSAEVAFHARRHDAAIQARQELDAEIGRLRQQLARVDGSVTWRIVRRLSAGLYGAVGGRGSLAGRAIGLTMRGVGRLGSVARTSAARLGAPAATTPPEPILTFRRVTAPVVSIVIPVHSGADVTERCLRNVLDATEGIPYEVIVVDDAADEATRALLGAVRGITVLTNERNLGYLRSVNRGSAAARGTYLVQLNNDTEPQPGWLAPLVSRVESAPDIGVVVAKQISLDGTLLEAGGIVWRDGSAWNYGRGAAAWASAYNYAREVDYGSAAALLVRAELWDELGGFDERYVPAYYEDTDLCFAARAQGYRVVYEPASIVVHHEGASMGTDLTTGLKAYQRVNARKFAEKWASALAAQHPGPEPELISLAADRRDGPWVVVIDHRVPRPDHDSGSLRMWRLLENLTELGYRVTFIPDDLAAPPPYTAELEALGIQVAYGPVGVSGLLAGLSADTELAIVSRPYVAGRFLHLIREVMPGVPVAYDTVDLHYVREERRAELEGNPDRAKADGLKELELAIARSTEVTLTVSDAEADRVRSDAGGAQVRVVPNANSLWSEVAGRHGRDGVLFVGGFEHGPNVDAAVFLAAEVMPLVWREAPGLHLTIVGADAPPEVLALAGPDVTVAGWVKELDPLLASSIALVAPLRYGAGVKGKVTQSLAAGLPVITSDVGAEGLDARPGEDILIAAGAAGFAEAVTRLARDDALWAALSESGPEIVGRLGSIAVQREALARLLAEFGRRS